MQPYGDPHAPFQRKCAFDVGDYGLGFCANSLALGCDCLGHIKYFDAVLNDSKGESPAADASPELICPAFAMQTIPWNFPCTYGSRTSYTDLFTGTDEAI